MRPLLRQPGEALLDDGLDRYFNGRFEDAIHLWTRVLFLDRIACARPCLYRSRPNRARRAASPRRGDAAGQPRPAGAGPDRGRAPPARRRHGRARRRRPGRGTARRSSSAWSAPMPRLGRVSRRRPRPQRPCRAGAGRADRERLLDPPRCSRRGCLLVIGVTSTDIQDWVGLGSDREQLLSSHTVPKLRFSPVRMSRSFARRRCPAAAGWPRRFKCSIAWDPTVPHDRPPTSCGSRSSNSFWRAAGTSPAAPPILADDEMSQVSLPEF